MSAERILRMLVRRVLGRAMRQGLNQSLGGPDKATRRRGKAAKRAMRMARRM